MPNMAKNQLFDVYLYWDQTASVRIMNELSMKYEYNKELDKDVLHLPLFSIYTQKRFSDIIINMKGVNVGGKIYNNHRYMG